MMTITMHARSEKRRELLQTLYELCPFLSKEPGYHDARIYVNPENANHVILVEEWDSQHDMECYLQSNYFSVLQGAMKLLTSFSDITFSPIPQIAHMIKEGVEVLIVCAGMEGALPSVVAGLVDIPVIGVPTSVGYGVGEGGVVALNAMLQSCAPGIAVVNIDNGFGAGVFALTIIKGR